MRFLILFFLISAQVLSYSTYANESDRLDDVWMGTLGQQKIIADFISGNYFYLRYLKPIPLYPTKTGQPNPTEWREGNQSDSPIRWTLQPINKDTISGTWIDQTTHRQLPIRLERFKSVSGYSFDLTAGDAPIAEKLQATFSEKFKTNPETTFEGKRYRTLSASKTNAHSLELLEQGSGIPIINQLLLNGLHIGINNVSECSKLQDLGTGDASHGEFSIAIIFWNQHWITFSTAYDCSDNDYPHLPVIQTWDLNTGYEVDIWRDWLNNDPDSLAKLHQYLVGQLIKARTSEFAGEKDACDTAYDETLNGYQVRLKKQGLVFTPKFPRVSFACTTDAEIPFKQLQPYLSPAGKKAIALLSNNP